MALIDCIFCNVKRGALVFEDADALVILDDPVRPGHVLVGSRFHAANLHDLAPDQAAAVLRLADRVAKSIVALTGADKMYVAAIGDKDKHFHVHLVPKLPGDPSLGPFIFGSDGWASFLQPDLDSIAQERIKACVRRTLEAQDKEVMTSKRLVEKPQVIVLDGVTGSGKSTLLQYLRTNYSQSVHVGTKFTTRQRRVSDNDWEYSFVDAIADTYSRYRFQNLRHMYAVDSQALRDALAIGHTYATSCVNEDVIRLLVADFRTLPIYVFRPLASTELDDLLKSRGSVDAADTALRREELRLLADDYASKSELFRHVILNIGTKAQLCEQLSKLLESYGIGDDTAAILPGELPS
jgi:histidine triad (HIT) family protein